jgi:hypothetical protein
VIDEGAPWLESMRNVRTKVATPVSKGSRSASGDGLLGFNLLPDSEPAPGFGRIGEYRLQLIEYWRRTQRADGTTPEPVAAPPKAAPRPCPPVEAPTTPAGIPTRGGARKHKAARAIQRPASSLRKKCVASAPAAPTPPQPDRPPNPKHSD